MAQPADTSAEAGPFATFGGSWLARGWHIVPLHPDTKHPWLDGYSGGSRWRVINTRDVNRPKLRPANLGLLLPEFTVGIDVDQYGDKNGAEQLAALEADLGALPPAPYLTSRGPGPSGIRLYRLRDTAIPRRAKLGSCIEVCDYKHRFVMAPGAVHPTTGGIYACYGADGIECELPPVEEWPYLPTPWEEHLGQATEHPAGAGVEGLDALPKCADDEVCNRLAEKALRRHVDDASRHERYLSAVMSVVGTAAHGHQGAHQLLAQMQGEFVPMIAADPDRAEDEAGAAKEFADFVSSALAKADPRGDVCLGPACHEWAGLTSERPREKKFHPRILAAVPDPAPEPDGSPRNRVRRITTRSFAGREPEIIEWLVPGTIARAEVCALVGEETTGKGLWWCWQIAELTRRGAVCAVVATEDHYGAIVLPRLMAAGAVLGLVHQIDVEDDAGSAYPVFGGTHGDQAEVCAHLRRLGAEFLVVDPWISTVPAHLQVKDTQQARQALNPLVPLAQESGAAVMLVLHPNRSEGSPRTRVGLTAAMRQVARTMLWAIEDPEQSDTILVGVESSNIGEVPRAARFWRGGVPHPADPGENIGKAELLQADSGRTLREWDALWAAARRSGDGRVSDKWAAVVLSMEAGLVRREVVVGIFGGEVKAADQALSRWVKAGLLARSGERGVYEVTDAGKLRA